MRDRPQTFGQPLGDHFAHSDRLMRVPSPALQPVPSVFTAAFAAPHRLTLPRRETSVSVTRPSGPVPFTLARSTPSSAATRRATGEAFTPLHLLFSLFLFPAARVSFPFAFAGAASLFLLLFLFFFCRRFFSPFSLRVFLFFSSLAPLRPSAR